MINMTSRNGSEIRFNGSCMLYSIFLPFIYVWQLYAIFYFLAVVWQLYAIFFSLIHSCRLAFCTFLYGSCNFLYLSVLFYRRTLSVAFL